MDAELVMIGAPWCAPCTKVRPWVQEAAHQLSLDGVGEVTFRYTPIEDCTDDSILSVPTLIVLRDGVEVGRITRFTGRSSLVRDTRRMLEAPPVMVGSAPLGGGGYPVRGETPPCR